MASYNGHDKKREAGPNSRGLHTDHTSLDLRNYVSTNKSPERDTLIISALNSVKCPEESRSLNPIPESCQPQTLAKEEDGSQARPRDSVLVVPARAAAEQKALLPPVHRETWTPS